jgi:repressor of nif and glnA expression
VIVKEMKEGSLLRSRQQEIITILANTKDGITTKEIRKKLSDNPAVRTLRDDLTTLKEQRLVESRGRGRNSLWFIVLPKK